MARIRRADVNGNKGAGGLAVGVAPWPRAPRVVAVVRRERVWNVGLFHEGHHVPVEVAAGIAGGRARRHPRRHAGNKFVLVGGRVIVDGHAHLLHVIRALGAGRRLAHLLHRGH